MLRGRIFSPSFSFFFFLLRSYGKGPVVKVGWMDVWGFCLSLPLRIWREELFGVLSSCCKMDASCSGHSSPLSWVYCPLVHRNALTKSQKRVANWVAVKVSAARKFYAKSCKVAKNSVKNFFFSLFLHLSFLAASNYPPGRIRMNEEVMTIGVLHVGESERKSFSPRTFVSSNYEGLTNSRAETSFFLHLFQPLQGGRGIMWNVHFSFKGALFSNMYST